MQRKKIQKVAIVGAGVIGLYLGWKLSEAGHKVVIFEKKAGIWDKPCSGLISERIENFISLDNSLIEKKFDSCLVHFPNKIITLNLKPVHYIIKRKKLNEYLAGIARKSGAKILFNKTVDSIPQGFDRIIGCDGALSKTRESLSLRQPFFCLGIQVFIPKKSFLDKVEVWPVKSGFFWKIPDNEETEYGLIGLPKTANRDFKKIFYKLTGADADKIEKKLAIIPCSLILPSSKQVTLCGDAAGLTKPWSGGGVIWGLTAADILLKNFPDFEKYKKQTERFFNFKISKGKFTTFLVNFLGNNFSCFMPSKMARDNDFPLF